MIYIKNLLYVEATRIARLDYFFEVVFNNFWKFVLDKMKHYKTKYEIEECLGLSSTCKQQEQWGKSGLPPGNSMGVNKNRYKCCIAMN